MSLKSEMVSQGNWLFKNRSHLPLVLFVLAAFYLAFLPYREFDFTSSVWLSFCGVVSFLGLIVRSLVIGTVLKGTSGRNIAGQKAEVLNTKGIYSIVRHPLYLGNYLMWLGPILYTCSMLFAIIASLLFWLYYERIMMAEENFLMGKFDDYHDWASRTPPFFPNFSKWVPAELSFSFRNVVRREFYGVVATIISFAFVHQLHLISSGANLVPGMGWIITLAATLLLFFVLRLLKKKTKILDTERS